MTFKTFLNMKWNEIPFTSSKNRTLEEKIYHRAWYFPITNLSREESQKLIQTQLFPNSFLSTFFFINVSPSHDKCDVISVCYQTFFRIWDFQYYFCISQLQFLLYYICLRNPYSWTIFSSHKLFNGICWVNFLLSLKKITFFNQ